MTENDVKEWLRKRPGRPDGPLGVGDGFALAAVIVLIFCVESGVGLAAVWLWKEISK